MSSRWESRNWIVAAAIVFLVGPGMGFASAQTQAADEDAWIKKYLDENGGYKTSEGGYYNPKAGTYTDKDGLVADNWGGVTYKDGSYKTQFGDYYDAPTKTYKLADGRVAKVENLTAKQAVKALRDNVEANGGYDKDGTIKSMIVRIKLDHPPKPTAKPKKP
jgi:hypothetical protein